MHLSEGLLHFPTLAAGALFACAGVAFGLRQLTPTRLPLTAVFAAAFFVASTIHIPVGIGSVHLILNGIAGLFLGWAVFPALFIALLLQWLLFSFGGLTVLGVNLCIMALPAVAAHYLLRPWLNAQRARQQLIVLGVGSALIGLGGAMALASLVLALDAGQDYYRLIGLLWLSHIPVLLVDSAISAGVVLALAKMYPQGLSSQC